MTKKSLTKFGMFVKNYCNSHQIFQAEIAKVLDVSAPFLSAVLVGDKGIPINWNDKLLESDLSFSEGEKEELAKIFDDEVVSYQFNVSDASPQMKSLVKSLHYGNVSDDIIEECLKLINKNDG